MLSSAATIAIPDLLADVVNRLVIQFHPLKIILFGSYARSDTSPDSDLDFLIVMPDGTDRHQSAIAIHRHLSDLPLPKDIIVTTPSEITERGQLLGTVLKSALLEGKLLYEQK